MSNQSIAERAKGVLFGNYRQAPVALVRGLGVKVWDADGREYLDFIGGIATTVLGHAHPAVRAAVEAQLGRLWHASNLFFTEPQVALAERLVESGHAERAFFCNSGTEANEAAIKLVRKWQRENGHPERFELLCATNSFHGRTLGSLSATGQPKYHQGFEPLVPGFVHLPYGDLSAWENAVGPQTAGLLVECVQGEAGVLVPPPDFLRGLRRLADAHGLVLVFDEVQGGFGRTGKLWSFEWEDVTPDAFTLAKGLGNGLPIGALLAKERFARVLTPGTHASTFGGNPVAASAAIATYDELTRGGAMAHGARQAERMWAGLERLRDQSGGAVESVRGRGLWAGVVLSADRAPAVLARARELGLLLNAIGDRVLRLAPALVISDADLDRGLELLAEAIRSA